MSIVATRSVAELRRRRRPKWLRYVFAPLFWLVLRPLAKLFPHWWARTITRAMNRMLGKFGDYRPRAHDVLVCSYFKSGTNWTMQIATQIAYRGHAEFEHIHDIVPWPEMPARSSYAVSPNDDNARRAAPTGLRVMKTHLPLGVVPDVPEARYIAVVRDPKDVLVSSYHFMRAVGLGRLMPSVNDWVDVFLSADTPTGSWAEHLASYWRVRNRSNVLFLTYEEMRVDLPAAVDRIASFLGVDLTSEERAAVIAQSQFAHMKQIGHKFDPPGAPWASAKGAMMRRGERGTSGELLTQDQQRRVDAYWGDALRRLGCDFPYDGAYALEPARAAAPLEQAANTTAG